MSAMLPNPLTPPNEQTTSYGPDLEIDSPPAASAYQYYGAQQLATPQSHAKMGLEDISDIEDRSESQYMSDEDQDMSDGGADLTKTLSRREVLDSELDLLDTEILGEENHVDMMEGDHYSLTLEDAFSTSEPSPAEDLFTDLAEPMEDTEFSLAALDDIFMHGGGSHTSLPNTMSAVSLQLLHLQNGQEQEDADVVDEEPHGNYINNSTPSILLPFLLSMGVDGGNIAAAAGFDPLPPYVSPADMSSSNTSSIPAAAHNELHIWDAEGSTPSLLDAVVTPVGQPLPSSAPFVDLSAHENSEQTLIAFDVMSDVDDQADLGEVTDQLNLSLGDFLLNWGVSISSDQNDGQSRRRRGPSLGALERQRYQNLAPVDVADLQGEKCDIQRINWSELGVSRSEARQMRRHTYKNYANTTRGYQFPLVNCTELDDDEDFFRFQHMDFDHDVFLSHFQLRNLMACASRDHLYYASRSKVLHWNPCKTKELSEPSVAMDLTEPDVQPLHSFPGFGIQISTLTAAHDILVAGGFCGEYSLMNLKSPRNTKHTEGVITDHNNAITNHVEVYLARRSGLPLAAFASNDNGMRILDIGTNKFIAEHAYKHAINCTAVSPDLRLRVLVGDTTDVLICNAETGETLQSLEGHRDYGFACDWADDGWTVATGNQDKMVKIWDARKWTNSSGVAQPVTTIAAEVAGVRKLKFSPLGSGKRVLLAAEPADIISVIDAQTFTSKQTLSFFGEIGGVDFTNDGQNVFVAICDNMRGGIMEFERCDSASGDAYDLEGLRESHKSQMGSDEEAYSYRKVRGTIEQRNRKQAALGISMGYF